MLSNVRTIGFGFIALALILLLGGGCASQRKCNGKRGVRTPMGLM